MWNSEKDKKYSISLPALFITIIIHVVLFIVLYFISLKHNNVIPKDDMRLTIVSDVLGQGKYNDNQPLGGERSEKTPEPSKSPNITTPTPTPTTSPKQKDPVTKTNEISKPEKIITQNKPSDEEIKAKQEAERKARQEAIDNNVANAFGKKSANDNASGLDKGNTSNAAGSGKGSGSGSYSLEGRSIVGNGGLPIRPNTTKAIYGRIVVGILVNSSGIVTDAWIDPQGTQIANPEVRNSAIAAARATKFNAISTSSNQRGKIIYNFTIK